MVAAVLLLGTVMTAIFIRSAPRRAAHGTTAPPLPPLSELRRGASELAELRGADQHLVARLQPHPRVAQAPHTRGGAGGHHVAGSSVISFDR